MTLWVIFITAFFIGFSGAMMPGPMLGITIDSSLKKGFKAGPLIVFGHVLADFTWFTTISTLFSKGRTN